MQKVVQHDGLAAGILTYNYTGGTGQYAVWKDLLLNSEAVLQIVARRLVSDYENMSPKMRKALKEKDLEARLDLALLVCVCVRLWPWQGCCCMSVYVCSLISNLSKEDLQRVTAAYHACCMEFKNRVPSEYFATEMKRIDRGSLGQTLFLTLRHHGIC